MDTSSYWLRCKATALFEIVGRKDPPLTPLRKALDSQPELVFRSRAAATSNARDVIGLGSDHHSARREMFQSPGSTNPFNWFPTNLSNSSCHFSPALSITVVRNTLGYTILQLTHKADEL